jgi:hypothetical protein
MKVKKTDLRPIIRPLEVKKVFILYCDDGWTYLPLLKIRRKFEFSNTNLIYTEEPWDDSISSNVLYEELVLWTLYSLAPRIWSEQGQAEDPKGFIECFTEIA